MLVETYKGIRIEKTNDPAKPFSTFEEGVPIMGTIEHVHETIEAAKSYIDKSPFRKDPVS